MLQSFIKKLTEDVDVYDITSIDYKKPMTNMSGVTYNGTPVMQNYNNTWFPRIKQDVLKLLKAKHSSASAEQAYFGYIQSADSFISAFDCIMSGNDPTGAEYTSFGYVSIVFVIENGMYKMDQVYDGYDSFYKPNNNSKMSFDYINKNRDELMILDIGVN
jgi:hypothetical protein